MLISVYLCAFFYSTGFFTRGQLNTYTHWLPAVYTSSYLWPYHKKKDIDRRSHDIWTFSLKRKKKSFKRLSSANVTYHHYHAWVSPFLRKLWYFTYAVIAGYVTSRTYISFRATTTDIYERSQTYTTLRYGVVSYGAQFGGLRVFSDHTRKSKRNTNAFTIFVRHTAFYMCLSSRPDRSTCRKHMHLTNHDYFDYGKTCVKSPNLNPMPGSR